MASLGCEIPPPAFPALPFPFPFPLRFAEPKKGEGS